MQQAPKHRVRKRLLVLAGEILVGIVIVVLIFFYATNEHAPWMPRAAVLNASFWMILGLTIIAQSLRTRQLQRRLLGQQFAQVPALQPWLVPLVLGIAAVFFGTSRLTEIYRRGIFPNGAGRMALFAFYGLSGVVSLALGAKLIRWGFRRDVKQFPADTAKSEAISLKQRISMVAPGVFLSYEGVRLLIIALLVARG